MSVNSSKKVGSLGRDMRLMLRVLPYMVRQGRLFWGGLLLYPLNAASVVLPPFILQQIFDRVVPTQNHRLLVWLSVAYLSALIIEYVSGFFSEYMMSRIGQVAMTSLRRDLFSHVQKLPMSFFEHHALGRLLTRMTSDVEAMGEIFSTGAVSVISDALSVVAVVGMMLVLSVKLTLAAFAIVPLLCVIAVIAQRFARVAFADIRRHLARLNAFLGEHIQAMSMVQAFGQEERTQKEFWQLNEDYRDANRQAIFTDASLYALVEAIGTVAVAAIIGFGATDLAQGSVTAGVLVAFMQYIRRFFVPVRDLSTKYTILQSAFASAERAFGLLDEPLTLVEAQNAAPVARFCTALELKNVKFRFAKPESEDHEVKDVPKAQRRWVLDDISLNIERGETLGLIGATGSGKTTLLKLLNRLYDVSEGRIVLDGVDVRQLKLIDLRRLFAVVLQDATLLSGTVMQNLRVTEKISEAMAKDAASLVGAAELIGGLPQGFDTHVRDLGANFSAGEQQLLALARAVAIDPQILLMDEATSRIDSKTEAAIERGLDVLLKDRTAIIVAHRLSTVRRVDRLIVLDHGRIVQQGSHDSLKGQDGPYRAFLHQAQAQSAGLT